MITKLTPNILLDLINRIPYKAAKISLIPIQEVINVFTILDYKHESIEIDNSGYFICSFVKEHKVVYNGSLITGECFINILEDGC